MIDIRLSDRLSAVLNAAKENSTSDSGIIDVGSDHGHLAAYAVINKLFTTAVCTDIHEDPARKSSDLMKDAGLSDKVSVFCTDGLDGIEMMQGDTVVMAGLGGNNMIDIISRVTETCDKQILKSIRFILQPQKSIEVLRESLSNIGYKIMDESVIAERGIYYPVLVTGYTGEAYDLSLRQKYYGPVLMEKFDNDVAMVKEYFIRLDSRYQLRARGDSEIKRLIEEAKL